MYALSIAMHLVATGLFLLFVAAIHKDRSRLKDERLKLGEAVLEAVAARRSAEEAEAKAQAMIGAHSSSRGPIYSTSVQAKH